MHYTFLKQTLGFHLCLPFFFFFSHFANINSLGANFDPKIEFGMIKNGYRYVSYVISAELNFLQFFCHFSNQLCIINLHISSKISSIVTHYSIPVFYLLHWLKIFIFTLSPYYLPREFSHNCHLFFIYLFGTLLC